MVSVVGDAQEDVVSFSALELCNTLYLVGNTETTDDAWWFSVLWSSGSEAGLASTAFSPGCYESSPGSRHEWAVCVRFCRWTWQAFAGVLPIC